MVTRTLEKMAQSIQVDIDENNIATILLDQPGAKVNVMNVQFIEELDVVVSSLPRDLRGVVVASGKENNFLAGADLQQTLQAENLVEASQPVRQLHRVLNKLEKLKCPSVAAINGAALGGGLELALACDYRVCVQSDKNFLGLPEVTLGLLPAGGGTQRLPRLIGLSRALGLILEGKRYSPKRALRYGVVDEVVHPAVLMDAAREWLNRGKRRGHPKWDRLDCAATRWGFVRSIVYRQAEKTVRKTTRGHYPAPLKALDAIRAGQQQGTGAGLAAEAVAFGQLATDPVAHNLIHLFFATEGLKKEQRRPGGVKLATANHATDVRHVSVIGAGFMGAGIAQAAAVAGCTVRVRDSKPEAVAKGLKTARDLTISASRKGRFSRTESQAIVSRLSGTMDYSGFKRAQLVIEAVFEDVAVKRAVLEELEAVVATDAVIASNTSSLPIASLAVGAKHPERIVGMHFFSPVHKMPLLEVIRAANSSEVAIATAVEMGRRMGKTVIVVGDGPGFYTTRVLSFMVHEAGMLFDAGASIEDIDRAMTAFGFPVGPLALTDEVGIDVAAHVSEILHSAFPHRFSEAGAINKLVAAGRLGRKSKAGFYDYSGRKKKPDPAVYAFRSSPGQAFSRELMQRRMSLAFVNEAARCLEESIIANPRDGDVGAVLGIGFPPFLGGPFRYADSLGAASVLEQLKQMEYAYGPSMAPTQLLVDMAKSGARFYQ